MHIMLEHITFRVAEVKAPLTHRRTSAVTLAAPCVVCLSLALWCWGIMMGHELALSLVQKDTTAAAPPIATKPAVKEPDQLPDYVITEWHGGKSIDTESLRRTLEYVTRAIKPDGSWCSRNVHDLLLETAAVETAMGLIVRQKNGPALSVWQILGFNFVEIREYFAKRDPELLARAMRFYNANHSEEWNRVYNIPWTAAMSLLFYEKATRGSFLIKLDTIDSRGKLWKDIYNTRLGKGTVKRYKQRALEYVHVAMDKR